MMQPRTIDYLENICRATGYIARKVAESSLEDYLTNEDLRFAIERNIEITGESLVRIRDQEPAVVAKIADFRKAIGLRNVIAHDYQHVDDTQIWEIITTLLPNLAEEVRELLAFDEQESV